MPPSSSQGCDQTPCHSGFVIARWAGCRCLLAGEGGGEAALELEEELLEELLRKACDLSAMNPNSVRELESLHPKPQHPKP